MMVIGRRLICQPAGGDYPDPVAACAALDDLVEKARRNHALCFCPSIRRRPGRMAGSYHRKHLALSLDACSLCGVHGVAADLKVLLPESA